MKKPKHLLSATEMTTCRNGVKTYHIKMLDDLIPYSYQIFKQNPLSFIMQDSVLVKESIILS